MISCDLKKPGRPIKKKAREFNSSVSGYSQSSVSEKSEHLNRYQFTCIVNSEIQITCLSLFICVRVHSERKISGGLLGT